MYRKGRTSSERMHNFRHLAEARDRWCETISARAERAVGAAPAARLATNPLIVRGPLSATPKTGRCCVPHTPIEDRVQIDFLTLRHDRTAG